MEQAPSTLEKIQTTSVIIDTPKQMYFARLFSGRLNRQNYIIGSTVIALVPSICFLVVIFNILLSPDTFAMPYLDPTDPAKVITPQLSIMSLLTEPANEAWSLAGSIFIILSIPYLLSMQIRRQHDLNISGWLWLINIVPLLSFYSYLPGNIVTVGSPVWWMLNSIATFASFFSIYVSLWPGTKGDNKYGTPPLPRTSLRKDILLV